MIAIVENIKIIITNLMSWVNSFRKELGVLEVPFIVGGLGDYLENLLGGVV